MAYQDINAALIFPDNNYFGGGRFYASEAKQQVLFKMLLSRALQGGAMHLKQSHAGPGQAAHRQPLSVLWLLSNIDQSD